MDGFYLKSRSVTKPCYTMMCRKVTDTDWVYFQLFYMLEFYNNNNWMIV